MVEVGTRPRRFNHRATSDVPNGPSLPGGYTATHVSLPRDLFKVWAVRPAVAHLSLAVEELDTLEHVC